MKSFKQHLIDDWTEQDDKAVVLAEKSDNDVIKFLSQPPPYKGGGIPIGVCLFIFKASPHAYWIFNKDGWFRKEQEPGKGYGMMFRKMTRLGKPRTGSISQRMLTQNVKFSYLEAHFDQEFDEKNLKNGTGEIIIDQDTFVDDKMFLNSRTWEVDMAELIKWIDKRAKSKVWIP